MNFKSNPEGRQFKSDPRYQKTSKNRRYAVPLLFPLRQEGRGRNRPPCAAISACPANPLGGDERPDGLKERTVASPCQSENFACGPVTDVVHCLQFGKSRDTILSTRDLSKKRKRRRGRAFETSPETSPCGKIGRANSLIPRLCLVKKVRRRREHDRTEYVARKKIV
jgi:hypothetical protein